MCWRCFQNFDASAPVLAYGRKVKVGDRGLTGPTTAAQSEAGTLPVISGPNTGTLSFPQATIDTPTGIASGVAAGSHSLTVGWNGNSLNPASVTFEGGESHMAAIALGG
jgi:hypothetical protein